MTTSTIPATTSSLFTTPTTSATNSASSSSSSSSSSQDALNGQIAGNFNEFLQLLTTQLQNQNPLDPLDTNQFTQQLVEFASVEQQINMNTQLQTLVSLQQTAQATQAMAFAGATVTVNGSNAPLASGQAQWSYNPPSPGTATLTISNSTGQTVFTTTGTVQPGQQTFTWNGQDNNGVTQPDGTYTMSFVATDATGKSMSIPTTVTGVVSSVDVSQTPPMLTIGGQNYTVNQILSVQKAGSSTLF
jgi:flagellar basal-body rod modification protein FlgD